MKSKPTSMVEIIRLTCLTTTRAKTTYRPSANKVNILATPKTEKPSSSILSHPSFHFFLLLFNPQLPQGFGNPVGIRDGFKFDSWHFACGLNQNVAVIKHRSGNSAHFYGHVLNLIKIGLGNFSIDQINEIYVKNSFVGNDKNTEKPV